MANIYNKYYIYIVYKINTSIINKILANKYTIIWQKIEL